MEFEGAAKRLAQDQSKIKKRNNTIVSQKAKREAEYRKKQQERLRLERQQKQKQQEHMKTYMTACDRSLGVKSLSKSGSLALEATSIHGDGDKIALPPSVLQYLTEQTQNDMSSSSPWTFRVGILRKDYSFPSSPLLQTMQPPTEDDEMMDDDSDDENDASNNKAAYLDELSHKYLSYTYATVVEFTQEEGHVGLPASIASRLLVDGIPSTKTVDPAGDNAMHDDDEDEKTPGHLAYGAFVVPTMPVEVTLVKLPKGRSCTVIPTMNAIRNGFFNLKDVKLVLEQSLIRTRATLSINDLVHTWHRGIKYDLQVSSVTPSEYQAISIINTDLEVEIGANDEFEQEVQEQQAAMKSVSSTQQKSSAFASGKGHVLSAPTPATPAATTASQATIVVPSVELLPEPPADQTEGVCTVQIRGDGAAGRRRFNVHTATLKDLFAFASSLSGNADVNSFRLVTRFPRRVFALEEASSAKTLEYCDIRAGQEMFMVEKV